jgi:hypothetical protein
VIHVWFLRKVNNERAAYKRDKIKMQQRRESGLLEEEGQARSFSARGLAHTPLSSQPNSRLNSQELFH